MVGLSAASNLSQLTQDDVQRLLSDPSSDGRINTATAVAKEYDVGSLTANERAIAEDIFRMMAKDAEERVRKALSDHLKSCELLPNDVAMELARDVESVSLPIIEFSPVLTDDDLIEIINSQNEAKQVAVAKRETVSEKVSDALVETNNEKVVETLVRNPGAEIADPTFNKVVDRFGEKENIQEALVDRAALPILVAERLVALASEKIQEELVIRHEIAPDIASDIIIQSREKATVTLLSSEEKLENLKRLIQQLDDNGRLTPSLVMRALCTGDVLFFEVSLSHLAKVPLANARVLIHDAGPLGLKSLYEKAGMPAGLFKSFRIAVDVYQQTDYDGSDDDRERFTRTMIERVLTQVEDLDKKDLEYLMGKLSQVEGATMSTGADDFA